MDDALRVRVLERVAHLDEVLEALVERELVAERQALRDLLRRLLQDRREVLALHELHRVAERAAGAHVERVHRHDVGVLELRGDLHLGEEAAEDVGVTGHLGQHGLQGDLAPQVDVPSNVHRTHRALAEPGDQPEADVGHRRRGGRRHTGLSRPGALRRPGPGPPCEQGPLVRRIVDRRGLHVRHPVQLLQQRRIDGPRRAQKREEAVDVASPLGAVRVVERGQVELDVPIHTPLQLGEIHGIDLDTTDITPASGVWARSGGWPNPGRTLRAPRGTLTARCLAPSRSTRSRRSSPGSETAPTRARA